MVHEIKGASTGARGRPDSTYFPKFSNLKRNKYSKNSRITNLYDILCNGGKALG